MLKVSWCPAEIHVNYNEFLNEFKKWIKVRSNEKQVTVHKNDHISEVIEIYNNRVVYSTLTGLIRGTHPQKTLEDAGFIPFDFILDVLKGSIEFVYPHLTGVTKERLDFRINSISRCAYSDFKIRVVKKSDFRFGEES